VPLLVPPTPGLLGEVVLPVPVPVLPVPELLLELPVLPLRSWRRQSSFAMPVSTSQRLELELVPDELLGLELAAGAAGSEVELLLVSLGFVVALPGVGVVGDVPVLGLVGELVPGAPPMLLPLGLEVWAMERLATPRNAAATAA
jgi:hypothetical protein